MTPSGAAFDAWQLAFLFKHHPLSDFRLAQTGPASFALELAGATADDAAALVARLRAALAVAGWSGAAIDVRHVPPFAATGGKPCPFVATP